MREIREGSPVQGVRAPRGLHLRPTLQQETQVRPTQVRPNLLRRTSLLTRRHTVFVLRRAQSPFVTKYTRNLRLFQMFTANRCPTTLCGYVERVWELSSPLYSYISFTIYTSGKDLKMLLMLMWFAQLSFCCHCYVTILFVFIEWTIVLSSNEVKAFDNCFRLSVQTSYVSTPTLIKNYLHLCFGVNVKSKYTV